TLGGALESEGPLLPGHQAGRRRGPVLDRSIRLRRSIYRSRLFGVLRGQCARRAHAAPLALRETAMTAADVIALLDLKPHPREGGYSPETYRSLDRLPAGTLPRYAREKSIATAIYYLLTPDTFSALHRLPTDEIFHFYLGDAVTMLWLAPDGGRL